MLNNTTNTTLNKTFSYMAAMHNGNLDVWILTIYVVLAVLIFIGSLWIHGFD